LTINSQVDREKATEVARSFEDKIFKSSDSAVNIMHLYIYKCRFKILIINFTNFFIYFIKINKYYKLNYNLLLYIYKIIKLMILGKIWKII